MAFGINGRAASLIRGLLRAGGSPAGFRASEKRKDTRIRRGSTHRKRAGGDAAGAIETAGQQISYRCALKVRTATRNR
ncbi:MAG: hypothetical protein AAFR60_06475, partial [Pseudomonadota bacterium]